jgi:hypothetical protein
MKVRRLGVFQVIGFVFMLPQVILWVLGRVNHENVYLTYRGPLCSNGWTEFDVCMTVSRKGEQDVSTT